MIDAPHLKQAQAILGRTVLPPTSS
jgi:hypothetical protein